MKIIALVPHVVNFDDGSREEPVDPDRPATVTFRDVETPGPGGITLVRREPVISAREIERIEAIMAQEGAGFAVVSLPTALAARGTRLEGRVGSVIMASERGAKEKRAFRDRFSW